MKKKSWLATHRSPDVPKRDEKPEPLTEDKMKCVVSDGNISFEPAFKKDVGKLAIYFNYRDVKSAVDWLLKEIEKRENINFVMDELKVRWLDSEWWEGYCYALDWFKNLIKKAFSGVIEE